METKMLRLDKYLADSGYGTRKQVKEIIKKGRVFINQKCIKNVDYKIDFEDDEVMVDNNIVRYSDFEYYMLNKPKGVVSATKDNLHKTVLDLIDTKKRRDLFLVGRLDKDTEGIIIITNDGNFCNEIMSPNKHVEKKYFAILESGIDVRYPLINLIDEFEKGIDIGDEKTTKPAILEIVDIISDTQFAVTLIISEGRFHQVKRMFKKFDYQVTYLKRLSIGGLELDENLQTGEFRKITNHEIELIKKSNY